MSRRSLVLPFLVTVLVCACASPPAPAPTEPASAAATADVRVDGTKAKNLVTEGARLVDVRTAEEFGTKHIEGAVNAPVDTIGDRDLGAKDAPLVLYCASGARAARAATTLRAKGYTRVYELGGMSNWEK